ncbi:MAG: NERD domain-containing protein [Ilumatobacteraceae bacterium]
MARLLPVGLDLHDIEVTAEREVVRILRDGLDDSWVVVPGVRLKDGSRDREIDILIASPTRGVIVIEVKGGAISIDEGVWRRSSGEALNPQPDAQIEGAKHALARRLKAMGIDMRGLFIIDAVSLPAVRNVPESGAGVALPRERILDGTLLDHPQAAIEALLPEHDPVPLERFSRFLSALKPTIELDGRVGRASPAAMRLLDQATIDHLTVARGLDVNQRVVATGGPGTGKSWLIVDWARRAVERGERTAVICFNKPISEQLASSLADVDVTVATYHSLIIDHLMAGHDFAIPPTGGAEYWDHTPTTILMDHIDSIERRFDTFIIDEGQDLRPHWLDSLEALLDPVGPRRILMTIDPEQMIYVGADVWREPEGAMRLPLGTSLRSCRHVADVVLALGGPGPLPAAPAGMPTVRLASGNKETVKNVRKRVRELVEDYGVPHSEILVLATSRDEQRRLLESSDDVVTLVEWEARAEGVVPCETVHRTKGIEATAVILVAPEEEPRTQLVYIGASRAVWSLTLIGPATLGELCGLTG